MGTTAIEWTHIGGRAGKVWNPVTGCNKVSAGCKNCYAERIAGRFWGERKFSDIQIHRERFRIPLSWKEPANIFVNSMSDLFHEKIPFETIREIFAIMSEAEHHTFMILTKRPARMMEYFEWNGLGSGAYLFPGWIWIGVSVENQRTADERIPYLLRSPARINFVSAEPLLSDVRLFGFNSPTWGVFPENGFISWVIAGGESGPNARPLHPAYARSLRDQCSSYNVPFFFKQWGEYLPESQIWREPGKLEADIINMGAWKYLMMEGNLEEDSTERLANLGYQFEDRSLSFKVGKKRAGSLLDEKIWSEFPDPDTRMK